MQDEVIDTTHSEGTIDPASFARLHLQDLNSVHAAIRELAEQGLLECAEGDAYRLTKQGEAIHRAREQAHRADALRRTRSWQSR